MVAVGAPHHTAPALASRVRGCSWQGSGGEAAPSWQPRSRPPRRRGGAAAAYALSEEGRGAWSGRRRRRWRPAPPPLRRCDGRCHSLPPVASRRHPAATCRWSPLTPSRSAATSPTFSRRAHLLAWSAPSRTRARARLSSLVHLFYFSPRNLWLPAGDTAVCGVPPVAGGTPTVSRVVQAVAVAGTRREVAGLAVRKEGEKQPHRDAAAANTASPMHPARCGPSPGGTMERRRTWSKGRCDWMVDPSRKNTRAPVSATDLHVANPTRVNAPDRRQARVRKCQHFNLCWLLPFQVRCVALPQLKVAAERGGAPPFQDTPLRACRRAVAATLWPNYNRPARWRGGAGAFAPRRESHGGRCCGGVVGAACRDAS